jgi:quinohemoprotein ethanol dehydrogenase
MKEKARATWSDGEWKQTGGGGTVWDAIAYDPELDLLYIGVGNGTPWNHRAARAARATTCSCPRSSRCGPTPASTSGTIRRRPAKRWDYTATQHIMLADAEDRRQGPQGADAGAQERLLLCPRPRHRQLISAKPYVPQTWTRAST